MFSLVFCKRHSQNVVTSLVVSPFNNDGTPFKSLCWPLSHQGVPVKAKNRVSVCLPFSYSNYSHENNLCNCSASAQSEFTFHQNLIVSTGRWKLKIVSTKIC
jgi:hypothetical protein